jgi:hypothetical protein
MLLNLSNHPSPRWPAEQLAAAEIYGPVRDLPFPHIPPEASTAEVQQLAGEYLAQIQELAQAGPVTVHLMGELTFVYMLAGLLRQAGIPCLAGTTARIVHEEEDGRKVSQFQFVQFRNYW